MLEVFVLVFALEHFIIRPKLAERRTGTATAADTAVSSSLTSSLPPMGAAAVALKGLSEVVPAYPAMVDGLAVGAADARAAQLTYSRDTGLPVEVENSIGIRFRLIPPGTFVMGSPAGESGRWEGEREHVAVIAKPFYMSKYETTQAQWSAIMESNPSYFKGSDRPVEEVTWTDCMEFALKLSEKEGLSRGAYRLPGEPEWEYACRAGTQTAFYFGDDQTRLERYAVFIDNGDGRSQAVGGHRPNAYGLYNMHGNVWEWCFDVFKNYPNVELPGPTNGLWRVVRGGNWRDLPKDCRSAERSRLPPASHGNLLGFRLVRTIPELDAIGAD